MTDMDNLVNHAKRELAMLHPGEQPDPMQKLIEDFVIETVQKFSEMGHSGSSAAYTTGVLLRLLDSKNLSPLTNSPAEWHEPGKGMWQNRRCSEAFSTDGGKTYYLLSEREWDETNERYVRPIVHTSEAV